MKTISVLVGRIRPQIFLALSLLGLFGGLGIMHNITEVTIGALAGIIALAKDVLAVDSTAADTDGD
jgi:hypothetical protein